MWTKNIQLGIEAFRRLREQSPRGQRFRLVIAGMVDKKSQPYLQALQAQARGDCGIDFVVSPSDEELKSLYERCYAVLFTAFNEDWGLVPLEAMAAGSPVISVERGGPRESILHGETGFLVPPEPDAFAHAMAKLVRHPELAATMGAAARERAAAFPWQAFVSRIDTYIDSLAAPQKLRGAAARVA